MTHRLEPSDCGGERTEVIELVTLDEHLQLVDRYVNHVKSALIGFLVLFTFTLFTAIVEYKDAEQIRLLSKNKSAAILELQEKVRELEKRTVPVDRTLEVRQLQDKYHAFETTLHCFDTRQDHFDESLEFYNDRLTTDCVNFTCSLNRMIEGDLVTQQRICDLDHRLDVITAFTKRIRPCCIFSLQRKHCGSVR